LYTDRNPEACSIIITKPVCAVHSAKITVPSAMDLMGVFSSKTISIAK
jgi:hypothetical protein